MRRLVKIAVGLAVFLGLVVLATSFLSRDTAYSPGELLNLPPMSSLDLESIGRYILATAPDDPKSGNIVNTKGDGIKPGQITDPAELTGRRISITADNIVAALTACEDSPEAVNCNDSRSIVQPYRESAAPRFWPPSSARTGAPNPEPI